MYGHYVRTLLSPYFKLCSVWSPDFFEVLMAANNAVIQENRVFRQITSTHLLEGQL